MSEQDWRRAKEIFGNALDLPAEERAKFLDAACAGDAELRARIEGLLASHSAAGEFLGAPTAPALGPEGPAHSTIPPTAPLDTAGEALGQRIGPYTLLSIVGEGGFGVVYAAEQHQPLHRRVALKVIKLGMDTRQVITRFEQERQALALMDHPGIAKVFDAGATATGRPYFVMEFIKGVPITEYCDMARLATAERLELCMQVCEAVQHAHQKGIIHRDLKPSNVLVTLQDGKPVPKIIDFGVAKATAAWLTEKTVFTEQRQFIGTPEYMSPEQADPTGLDIDTRSDVYSLGVLLYELLIGATPIDPRRLRSAAFSEMQRIIREIDPPKPSTRLSTLENLANVAACRQTEPKRLGALVRGDLDWIAMRCLEKDRSRRYETASALAADLDRHLRGEAVAAAPPSAKYRTAKFMRRHRVGVIATAVLAVTLVGGVIATTWQAVRAMRAEQDAFEAADDARHERDRAREATYVGRIAAASASVQADDWAGLRRQLAAAPEEYRGWEWRHLQALSETSLLTIHGHSESVTGLAFSPNGDRLVSVGRDGMANVWDAKTGNQLQGFRAHDGSGMRGPRGEAPKPFVQSDGVAFSPDGGRVVAGFEEMIYIWDVRTGNPVLSFRGLGRFASAVVFSANGARVFAGAGDRYRKPLTDDVSIKGWDAQTGRELSAQLVGEGVLGLSVCDQGIWAVTGGGGSTLRVWDVDAQRSLFEVDGHWRPGSSGASLDRVGRRLVAWDGDEVGVWDVVACEKLLTVHGHTARVSSVAFTPDGSRLVSGSSDTTVRVWDAATGRELQRLRGHEQAVKEIVVSPDGTTVASASVDGTIQLWNIGPAEEPVAILRHEYHMPKSIALSPDGSFIVVGFAESVAAWDIRTGDLLIEMPLLVEGGPLPFAVAAFSSDGVRLLAARSVGEGLAVTGWDAATLDEIGESRIASPESPLAFSSEGSRYLTSSLVEAVFRVRDVVTGKELVALRGHEFAGACGAFTPDGTRVATGSHDMTVKVWRADTGDELLALRGHESSVTRVAFSSDGRELASGSADGTIKTWDALTGDQRSTLAGHASAVLTVAYSPDGTRIVSGSFDRTVKVWDTRNGEELLTLRGHEGEVREVVFSADGGRIFSAADDGTVRIWDTLPARVRADQRREARSLYERAGAIVDRLQSELREPSEVIRSLRRDPALSESLRQAAMNLVLKRRSQVIRERAAI